MDKTVKPHEIAFPKNPEIMPEVSLDECHSPMKVLAHDELIQKFVNGESFNPVHMRLGIQGACNMRCNFCNFHSSYEVQFYDRFSYKDLISTEKTKKLISDFAASGGRAVTFCGSGECTTHPGYAEICDDARAHGIKIGLITNGARLHKPDIARAVSETHTWVRIGMNAGTPETFSHITKHKPETFNSLLGAVQGLRDAALAPDFRIGLNYVITDDNYQEIDLAAKLAGEAGAHYVRFEPEFYSAKGHETVENHYDEISDRLMKATTYGTLDFEVSVPKLDRGPMDQCDSVEGNFEHCHYSRFVTAVGADGHLYPCPQVHLNSRYRIGDVSGDGYDKVLNGGPRAEWEASNPSRTDLCKSCFYRPQNELLEALISGEVGAEETLRSYRVGIPETVHADFV